MEYTITRKHTNIVRNGNMAYIRLAEAEMERIAESYEYEMLTRKAIKMLAEQYGIDLDDPEDSEENPGNYQQFEDDWGCSIDEAANLGGDHYVLDKLVAAYQQYAVPIADVRAWQRAIEDTKAATTAKEGVEDA